jgi:hypothetical protein
MSAVLIDARGRHWRMEDITHLCDAAARAWRQVPGRARQARFLWRGRWWVASKTVLRLRVHDAAGHPIACRWG